MDDDLSGDDIQNIYGRTPPRTKLLKKYREKKQKYSPQTSSGTAASTPSYNKPHKGKGFFCSRRHSTSSANYIYDELIAKADRSDGEQRQMGNVKATKRSMKLLRGSERDLKLDIASAQSARLHQDAKSLCHRLIETPLPSYHIESGKRFMSLICRTTPCHKRQSLPESKQCKLIQQDKDDECQQKNSRVSFYETLSLLIRMGNSGNGTNGREERNPRRGISRDESLWQNELKDLIWLELQAFHADRTAIEEDEYLCLSRELVMPLLNDIMKYKFERHATRKFTSQNSNDSGVEDDCTGCTSIYCLSCMEAQNEALRQVEDLMNRLENVEILFPSSKAFAELYPLYNSPQFVSRVKTITLWFNMATLQRVTLNILTRLVMENRNYPMFVEDVSSGLSSDSNNSATSLIEYCTNPKNEMYNIAPLAMLLSRKNSHDVSPYRKYIENMLKTRTLDKSLHFLESLHQCVLRKVHLTLKMPEEDSIQLSQTESYSEIEELQRFGSWSDEARNLSLPSYKAIFLFLVRVPLDVVHEYLKMKLEHKPDNPSPLSSRQLMRELKEGLRIAVKEREHFLQYIAAFKSSTPSTLDDCNEQIKVFNECLIKVFNDYLEYLEQWVLYHHNTFQKNLLEEEYNNFGLAIVPHISGGGELLKNKYAKILGTILQRITDRLVTKVNEILAQINKENVNDFKQTLFSVCRELQSVFNEERETGMKTMAFARMILFKSHSSIDKDNLKFLINSVVAFKCIIPKTLANVQNLFDLINIEALDDVDKTALSSRIREIVMQIYKFGFEFYKEMADGCGEYRLKLAHSMIDFAKLWMAFVTERCERGRGRRPRWANQGMEFLLTVCEPANTMCITDEEFEDLKKNMDDCISHLIGTTAPSTPDSGFISVSPRISYEHIRTRSRGSSPSPRTTYKSQRSSVPTRKTSLEQQQSPTASAEMAHNINGSSVNLCSKKDDINCTIKIKLPPQSYSQKAQDAVQALEKRITDKLYNQHLIGKVVECNNCDDNHIRRRNVTFSWQRGIKIGQGRFGKVYTAVNNNTGEMMAVKEINLQHNDNLTIKRVSDEMKILEGIRHENLVNYFGMEVYTDKMLLFMEYCAEGTLESLIKATENGLPELLVRRYTHQLLCGVACLHDHGIVHRDIKPANIFLTQEGNNCLKIGDFGCAAKIKSNITMPGELKGFVGTQVYMAPEVFTKNMNEGHGRAADIWSIGCVVVEMASGKRPWAQYDSNFQIMFKVGMGESPDPPDDMIDEGLDFLELCFKHNPKERATVHELLANNFVKVGYD